MKKLLFMLIAGLLSFAAHAQIPQPDPDTTAKHFLIVASIGNLQEVAAGQLASEKGKRTDVRQYGQMMVKHHGDAEQKLLQVAKARNIQLPAPATAPATPDLRLKNAGDKFAPMYVHAMVSSHNNTVQTFQNYANTGKDPQVRAFAQQTLPTLKQHLEEIKAIEKQMSAAAK